MKILVADALSQAGVDVLAAHHEVDVNTGRSKEELLELIPAYDAIVIRSATTVDADIIKAGTNLKVIARAGIGLDNVDVEAATAKGVLVCNAPQSNIISAAEQAITLIMAAARHVAKADASLRENKWMRNQLKGVELYGKTLGVIGLGRIGGLVVERLHGFGVKVIGYDPFISADRARQMKVTLCADVDTLCEMADIITIHLPRTPETINIIDKEQFAKMKPTTIVVNASRGGLVNEAALFEALSNNTIYAAGLDVFDTEPPVDNPLLTLDNLVAAPHLGASTTEAQDKAGTQVAEAVLDALKGEFVPSAVNLDASGSISQLVRDHMGLAETLGNIFMQTKAWNGDNIEFGFVGPIANEDTRVAQLSATRGLLQATVSEPVTFVNAPMMAKSRGMSFSTFKSDVSQAWVNEVRITTGKRSIGGALAMPSGNMRIIDFNGLPLDVPVSPNMIIMYYQDRTGIVGKIGRILGDLNVNIAGMQISRDSEGGKVVCILTVDTAVEQSVVDTIGKEVEAQYAFAVNVGQ